MCCLILHLGKTHSTMAYIINKHKYLFLTRTDLFFYFKGSRCSLSALVSSLHLFKNSSNFHVNIYHGIDKYTHEQRIYVWYIYVYGDDVALYFILNDCVLSILTIRIFSRFYLSFIYIYIYTHMYVYDMHIHIHLLCM